MAAKKAKKRSYENVGRPLTVIDWPKVEAMCQIQCTAEEIAGILSIDYDTLNGACKREKRCNFSDYLKEKGMAGKASLRRRQYKAAQDGNATMLVWLGKNWLGQSDHDKDHAAHDDIVAVLGKLIDKLPD